MKRCFGADVCHKDKALIGTRFWRHSGETPAGLILDNLWLFTCLTRLRCPKCVWARQFPYKLGFSFFLATRNYIPLHCECQINLNSLLIREKSLSSILLRLPISHSFFDILLIFPLFIRAPIARARSSILKQIYCFLKSREIDWSYLFWSERERERLRDLPSS